MNKKTINTKQEALTYICDVANLLNVEIAFIPGIKDLTKEFSIDLCEDLICIIPDDPHDYLINDKAFLYPVPVFADKFDEEGFKHLIATNDARAAIAFFYNDNKDKLQDSTAKLKAPFTTSITDSRKQPLTWKQLWKSITKEIEDRL